MERMNFNEAQIGEVIEQMAQARRHARDNAPHGSNDHVEAAMFLAMAAVVEKMYQIQADARELEDDDAEPQPEYETVADQPPAEESSDEPAYTYSEPEPEPEPEEPDAKRKRKHR